MISELDDVIGTFFFFVVVSQLAEEETCRGKAGESNDVTMRMGIE